MELAIKWKSGTDFILQRENENFPFLIGLDSSKSIISNELLLLAVASYAGTFTAKDLTEKAIDIESFNIITKANFRKRDKKNILETIELSYFVAADCEPVQILHSIEHLHYIDEGIISLLEKSININWNLIVNEQELGGGISSHYESKH